MYWIEFKSLDKWKPVSDSYNTWKILQLPTREFAEKQIQELMEYGKGWPTERSEYRIMDGRTPPRTQRR